MKIVILDFIGCSSVFYSAMCDGVKFMEFSKIILSRQNPLIVHVAKLDEKKHRERERLFRFDGIKLLREAVENGVDIEYVLIKEKNAAALIGKIGAVPLPCDRIILISDSVFDKLTSEKTPDGVICISKYIDKLHKIATINNAEHFFSLVDAAQRIIILESVRDAGNLGTVIRCAAAFGIDLVILSDDCADIYNPKTIRASKHSRFYTFFKTEAPIIILG